jgi:hypothetical protein
VAVAACAGNGAISGRTDLGLISTGEAPEDSGIFVTSDCGQLPDGHADCAAQDGEGRQYAFFGGLLSKVSATWGEAASTLRLPAALVFGENIELSAEKTSKAFGIKLERAPTPDGRTVYSSDFVLESSVGVMYSIELIADKQGRLVEVVERTDF